MLPLICPELFCDCVKDMGELARAIDRFTKKNAQRKAMRRVFRQEWRPTLHSLRDTLPKSYLTGVHMRLLHSWEELGRDMRLNGNDDGPDVTQQSQTKQFCAWKECPNHLTPPTGSLKNCKGCGEVVRFIVNITSGHIPMMATTQGYCGRACQRLDWNAGHKSRCKRLK